MESGPIPAIHGVVRWRLKVQTIPAKDIDLQSCIAVLGAALRDYKKDQDNHFSCPNPICGAHVDAAVLAKDPQD